MKQTVCHLVLLLTLAIILFSACTKSESAGKFTTDTILSQTEKQAETTSTLENGDEMKASNLIVNGTCIPTVRNIVIHPDEYYAELPLITIMETLGATVEWVDPLNATITYNQTTYALSTTDNTLCEVGKNTNYIALPPGTTHGGCYRLENREFYVDSDSMKYFLFKLGLSLSISNSQCTVYIDNKG